MRVPDLNLTSILAAALAFTAAAAARIPQEQTPSQTSSQTSSAPAPAFTYDRASFYLHGKPYVIIGGQMDPQRIPAVYWRDRLAKARAMGLNTVFSYVYWNLLEPTRGEWRNGWADEEGVKSIEGEIGGGGGRIISNDIARFFQIAKEEGLNVILRPGPYICGEREWGGFPAVSCLSTCFRATYTGQPELIW
jgi:hypothetical protein